MVSIRVQSKVIPTILSKLGLGNVYAELVATAAIPVAATGLKKVH